MHHSAGFLNLVNDAKGRIREITIAEVRKKLAAKERFHFIDVREDHEWAKGRCKGAQHLGRGILERDIESLISDKTEEIVLYCGGGFRSALSADNLRKMGFTRVYSMAGGFRGWVEAGAPVQKR